MEIEERSNPWKTIEFAQTSLAQLWLVQSSQKLTTSCFVSRALQVARTDPAERDVPLVETAHAGEVSKKPVLSLNFLMRTTPHLPRQTRDKQTNGEKDF